jgi:hypothetical protein
MIDLPEYYVDGKTLKVDIQYMAVRL